MLANKKSQESITCKRESTQARGSTVTLKKRTHITISPKQGPHNNGYVIQNVEETVTSLCFSDEIRGMIPQELLHANDMLNSVDGYSQPAPQLQGVSEDWLAFPKIVSTQLRLRNRPRALSQK